MQITRINQISFGENIETWKRFESRRDVLLKKANEKLLAIHCSIRESRLEHLQKDLSLENIDLVERICKDDKFDIGKVLNIAKYTNVKDATGLPLKDRNILVINLLEKMYSKKGAKNSFNMAYYAMHANEIGLDKIAKLLQEPQSIKRKIIQVISKLFKKH